MKDMIVNWRPFWKSKDIRDLVMREQEKEMAVLKNYIIYVV